MRGSKVVGSLCITTFKEHSLKFKLKWLNVELETEHPWHISDAILSSKGDIYIYGISTCFAVVQNNMCDFGVSVEAFKIRGDYSIIAFDDGHALSYRSGKEYVYCQDQRCHRSELTMWKLFATTNY